MKKLPVSVIINTLNEEKNIRNCLETVKWAEEIVLVDMHSDDKTVEIAGEYTNTIYSFERMGYVEPAREFALEKTSQKWVLIIDADELVSHQLKERLGKIIENDLADLVYIPRKNYFFGDLLKGGGWGAEQEKIPRFFKKGFVQFSTRIHEVFAAVNNPRILAISDLQESLLHFNYLDVEHFLEKSNRYTTIEANNIYEGQKAEIKTGKQFYRVFKEFISRFIVLRGYRDGYLGFYLAFLMAAYQFSTFTKLRLMKNFNSPNPRKDIEELYAGLTKEIVDKYKKDEDDSNI